MAEGTIDDVFIRLTAETSQLEQELAKARKKVDDYAKSVGIASDKTTASFKRISSAATPVQRAMRNVENAQRKLESITDITSQAYRDQAQAVAYLSAQLQNAKIKQTDMIKGQTGYALAATRGMGSTRAFGNAIQNMGYQVGDLAVQVASGQGFLRPFIQQGTQFVSMFGPTGAVIGAVGAIAGAVITYFTTTSDSAKEATEQVKAYENAIKDLIKVRDSFLLAQAERSPDWGSKEIYDGINALKYYRNELANVTTAYKAGSASLSDLNEAQSKVSETFNELRLAKMWNEAAKAAEGYVKQDKQALATLREFMALDDEVRRLRDVENQFTAGGNLEGLRKEAAIQEKLSSLRIEGVSAETVAEFGDLLRTRDLIEDNIKATEEFDNAYQKSIESAVELNRKRLDDEQEFAEATRTRIDDLKDENQVRSEYVALLAQGKMKTDEFNDARKIESELKKSNLAVGSAAYNQLRDQLELQRELIGLEKETVRSTGAFRAIEQTNKQTAATKALVKEYADGALTLEKYNEELEVQTALLGLSEEATQAERDALENSIRSRQAVTREFERVNEVAKLTEQIFNKAGDALADFAMNGKGDFKSLVDSMIADLIRYQIQQSIVKPLSGAFSAAGGFGGIFSSLFGGPAAATSKVGGYVIAAPGGSFAEGGHVAGPGTGTSDSIAANLSNGEFVINAQATKQNRALLEAINNGAVVQRFQSGGVVGGGAVAAATNSNMPSVNIYDMRSNQSAPVETQTRTGSDGRREIAVMIRDTVNTGISSGVHDKAMSQRFGVSPALTRRG